MRSSTTIPCEGVISTCQPNASPELRHDHGVFSCVVSASAAACRVAGHLASDDVRVLPIPASISKSISASIVFDGKRRCIAVRVHPVVGARTIAGSATIEVLSPSEPPQRIVLPIMAVLDSRIGRNGGLTNR